MTNTTDLDWEEIFKVVDADPPTWEQILTAAETTGLAWGGPQFWLDLYADRRRRNGHTTLYRLHDANGQLLYVGIAGNPGRRFEQHHADKPWWSAVARIDLEHHATRTEALDAERTAIQTEQPRYNVIHAQRRAVLSTG